MYRLRWDPGRHDAVSEFIKALLLVVSEILLVDDDIGVKHFTVEVRLWP
jgi:hypothetical protein